MELRGLAPRLGAKGVSFESRIAISALSTAIAVLVLACVVFISVQWRAEQTSVSRGISGLSQIFAQTVALSVGQGDVVRVRAELQALCSAPAVRQAQVLSPTGVVIAAARAKSAPIDLSDTAITTRTPLIEAGHTVGILAITVHPPAFRRLAPRYVAVCAALFFSAVAIALFLARALARGVVQPVKRLAQTMRDVTEGGDYSQRVPDWARDEFGELTDSFNSLLSQLQANDQALHRAMIDLLEARDAAQATNVLKSQFLANMSHEIRTPLNGVLTMAQIMAMGELAPAQRARIEVIRQSGEDLLTVLNDILDLSRIEAGKMGLEEGPLDLDAIKTELQALHGPTAAAKANLAFSIEVLPGAQGPRRGDQARVVRILANLVSNAIKFTPRGEVGVRLDGYGPDGRDGLKCEVVDTGVGIAPETLPLLFQKFSQADNSNTRRFGGAGLGLAICRGLVALMGGRIDVDSVVDQGSTFTVILPLPVIDPAAPSVAPREPERPLRVLAAEDIPTSQIVLGTILDSFGAQFEVVDNGRQAVEAWERENFDLILMDIHMPVMDGVAATRAIRAAEARLGRPRTPIIAVSASAPTVNADAYHAAGVDAHVAKPIVLEALHAAMGEVMGEPPNAVTVTP